MSSTTRCIFDSNIINEETLPEMSNLALSVFASLCGRNRGAFVLDPPDGQTYGCLNLPTSWSEASGITDGIVIQNSDNITKTYAAGNITATQVLNLLDFMNDAVYGSSANVQHDPYACNVNGLTTLDCTLPKSTLSGLKSVTLDGVLSPAPWGMSPPLTSTDFDEMQELGLTTIQIPISQNSMESKQAEIEEILGMAKDAGMTVILQQIPSAMKANKHNDDDIVEVVEVELVDSLTQLALQYTDTVVAISILSSEDIDTVRAAAPDLPMLVSIDAGDLSTLDFSDYSNVYASLEVNHAHVIADIASSTSVEDRSKLFYHESTSCILRSPIEFSQCVHQTPIFISGGFDLSIDDCLFQDTSDFSDYGQCDRFDETVDSPWWHEHRQSFMSRQLFAFEQAQVGWSFSAWKTSSKSSRSISEPSHLLGLAHVAAAGLYPVSNLTGACLNPPPPDFTLGDETLSPTPGPPPDCGNGWWNFTTNECSYWIPPPVPTCAPAPESSGTSPMVAGLVGAAVMGVVVFCTMVYGMGYSRRRISGNYDTIPN
eukprot:CAMPEP_0194231700 /NCGR_PEP_ID=MMETSP0158-20130606/343_1 /TAXON_ID=33649 /ORGANISM="Thalassionema nitzschioides, Strain L26-B" /LENGTH=541 /DNA_ID=CAMNT_0038964357 /DNA_START=26 /DNA_END=1651 /DNA_ORIENTATION=+